MALSVKAACEPACLIKLQNQIHDLRDLSYALSAVLETISGCPQKADSAGLTAASFLALQMRKRHERLADCADRLSLERGRA
ncbi:hypothetical protein [Roseibium suaedae]|nr:hypothetical protein [Roseibium suaedae]